MQSRGYSSEELRMFYAVLDRAVRCATQHNLSVSIFDMIERLFQAAGRGERDPERLHRAVLAWNDERSASF